MTDLNKPAQKASLCMGQEQQQANTYKSIRECFAEFDGGFVNSFLFTHSEHSRMLFRVQDTLLLCTPEYWKYCGSEIQYVKNLGKSRFICFNQTFCPCFMTCRQHTNNLYLIY